MKGLRTQEGNKFEAFFAFVQTTAENSGSIFFMDCGEGNDIVTDDLEGEDLLGWLIPKEKENEFEKEWKNGQPSSKWDEFITWAEWEQRDGKIVVNMKQY